MPAYRSELRASDAEAVERLVAATGFFNAEETGIARELVDETLQRGAASGYQFLFAEREGHLDGYTCFGRIPGTQSNWDLYWIVVDPACQGQGLGRRLLQASEQAVRAQGGDSVWIETSSRPQYAPTRALYLACGYALAAQFEDFYAPGDAKCMYRRRLTTNKNQ